MPRNNELKDRTPLRRYLDLAKYIDLLRTSSLYFRRADRFSDKFEGALTSAIRQKINEKHMSGSLKRTPIFSTSDVEWVRL